MTTQVHNILSLYINGYDKQFTRTEYQNVDLAGPEINPIYFGYPHRIASPQAVEPFWNQLPTWTLSDRRRRHPPDLANPKDDTMDDQALIIGSRSRYSRGPGTADRPNKPTMRGGQPREMVDLYIRNYYNDGAYYSDDFVQTIPLRLLVRFSKVAAEVFPKPADREDKENADVPKDTAGGSEQPESAVDVRGDCVNVSQPLNQPTETPEIKDGSANGPVIVNGSSPAPSSQFTDPIDQPRMSGTPPTKKPHHYMWLNLPGVEIMPSTKSFRVCLSWMSSNKAVGRGDRLIDFYIPESYHVPLTTLMDVYAAALSLDLRPFPSRLRHAIMDRLSAQKPLVHDIRYIRQHLTYYDSIVTRALTAYFEYWEAGRYSEAEMEVFREYVAGDVDLARRFMEIREARAEREKRRGQRRGQGMRKPTGQGGGGRDGGAEALVEGKESAGRRRNRREQKRNGMARAAAAAQNGGAGGKVSKTTGETPAGDVSSSNDDASKTGASAKGNGKGTRGRHVPGAEFE